MTDGDSVYVDSVIPRYSNMVEVRGAVFHSGMYQMDGNINTVRELVKAAEGLREDAFTARAVMHREKDDLTLEVLPVNIKAIMDGTQADIPLQKRCALHTEQEGYGRGTYIQHHRRGDVPRTLCLCR